MTIEIAKPKIGIALGSGAGRGWAHIGVLRALEARGIKIDIVAGCSIGSLIGAVYAGDGLDQFETWLRGLTWRELAKFIDLNISGGGFLRGEKILNYFIDHAPYTNIEDLPLPFASVATNIDSGEEVHLNSGSIVKALRASMAMPGFINAFHYQQQWLVDGGLVNPVPVSLCREMGADIVIAVNLNHDLLTAPEKKRAPSNTTLKQFKNHLQKLPIMRRKTTDEAHAEPNRKHLDVLNNTSKIMQMQITQLRAQQDPADILIEPCLGHLGMFDFQHAAETIDEGYQAVERAFAGSESEVFAR